MDFSPLNFVDSCQVDTSDASAIAINCYSSATALNEILLVATVLVVVTLCAVKLLNLRRKS